MIRVIFSKTGSDLVSYRIEGHAGFDEYNKDIVCSAVSAVVQTTLIGIQEVLKMEPEYSLHEGFLDVSVKKLSKADIRSCQVLMETMYLGLVSMEQSYGKYIKVLIEEV